MTSVFTASSVKSNTSGNNKNNNNNTSQDIHLWETLLKNSSKQQSSNSNRNDQQSCEDGTVLIVGDSGCGKHTLLEALTAGAVSARRKQPEYMTYAYYTAGEDSAQKVNVWAMRRETFQQAADIVLDPSRVENVTIAVTVDVSRPDCAASLFTLLALVDAAVQDFAARRRSHLAEQQVSVQKTGGVSFSGAEESKSVRSSSEVMSSSSTRPPAVLVVGCKADTLAASDVERMVRSKATQGELRAVCLACGVSGLIFTAASTASESSNCALLQKYLSASLQHLHLQLNGGVIKDGTTDVFIPDMRADSSELIRSATDVQADLVLNTVRQAAASVSFSSSSNDSPTPLSTTSDTTPSASSCLELLDESAWLQQLNVTDASSALAEQLTRSQTSSSGSTASTSTSTSTTAGTTRRKSTLATNPLAQVGTKSSSSSSFSEHDTLTTTDDQSGGGGPAANKEKSSGTGGVAKIPKKKKTEKEKKESPRGFFEDLLTK